MTMDKYGRIRIPKECLEGIKTRKFLVRRSGELIVLQPIGEKKLVSLIDIDSVEVDVDPEAFKDYESLKKALLGD